MADPEEIPANGEVDQTLLQSDNDGEESMEVQTIQTVGTVKSEESVECSERSIPYDDFKLFVGGLSGDTVKSTLENYFSEFGTVVEVNLKVDEITKRSRGFAFILFKESDAVDKVIERNPHTIDGKPIDSKKAIPHDVHQQMKHRTKKIFVGGVPTNMGEELIRKYFEKYGTINEVALVTDKGPERKRRGFCFVTFDNEDAADKVCAESFHEIDSCKVEVKRATPREQDNKRGGGGGLNSFPFGRGGGRGHSPFYGAGGRGGGMSPNFAPYGGAAYYPYYPPHGGYPGGGYMGGYGNYGAGYGGYATYEPYGGGRRDDSNYNSRYGPMRSYAHHNHSHGHGGSFHPYSR